MPIRILILGQIDVALPTPDEAVVELHLDVLGVIDFGAKMISIDASLHDSRVALCDTGAAVCRAAASRWATVPGSYNRRNALTAVAAAAAPQRLR